MAVNDTNNSLNELAYDMAYDLESAGFGGYGSNNDLGIVKSPMDYLKDSIAVGEYNKAQLGNKLLETGGPIGMILDKNAPEPMVTGYIEGDDIKGNKTIKEFNQDYLRKHFRKNIEKSGDYKSYQDWIDSDTTGVLSAMETGNLSMRSPENTPEIMELRAGDTGIDLKMLHDSSILTPEVFKDKYNVDMGNFKKNVPYDLLMDYIPTLEGKKEYHKRGFFDKPIFRSDYEYKDPGLTHSDEKAIETSPGPDEKNIIKMTMKKENLPGVSKSGPTTPLGLDTSNKLAQWILGY